MMDFTVLKNLQVRESSHGGFSKLPSKVKKVYLNTKQDKKYHPLTALIEWVKLDSGDITYLLVSERGETEAQNLGGENKEIMIILPFSFPQSCKKAKLKHGKAWNEIGNFDYNLELNILITELILFTKIYYSRLSRKCVVIFLKLHPTDIVVPTKWTCKDIN